MRRPVADCPAAARSDDGGGPEGEYRSGFEGPDAIADVWQPPHPLALPADMCDELREVARWAPV